MAENTIFSRKVLLTLVDNPMRQKIIEQEIGTDALKKVIAKEAQKANRRIQNVLKAGYASPAVKAVLAERGERGFTYFSTAGLNPKNKGDWERLKYEFGRIEAFLNNPTSSATGAKQYISYQAKSLGIPFDNANRIVDLATSPQIDNNGNINIFNYSSILDSFRNDVMTSGDIMEMESEEYADYLEEQLRDGMKVLDTEFEREKNRFFKGFMGNIKVIK